MTSTAIAAPSICRDLTLDAGHISIAVPYVLAGPDTYSVLIPGRADALTLINIALGTMAAYGLPVDATDEGIVAEVTVAQHIRLHRCTNVDHAFHPEFGVPASAPGAIYASRVDFTAHRP